MRPVFTSDAYSGWDRLQGIVSVESNDGDDEDHGGDADDAGCAPSQGLPHPLASIGSSLSNFIV